MVSGEFATGNGLASPTAPMTSKSCPSRRKPFLNREGILWGYVCNPMRLSRRGRGSHAMVAKSQAHPGSLPCTDEKSFTIV